jgi:hypothetical protein
MSPVFNDRGRGRPGWMIEKIIDADRSVDIWYNAVTVKASKIIMLLIALCAVLPGPVRSQAYPPPNPYLGLYTDEERTASCIDVEGEFVFFEMWVCLLPSYLGTVCVEFAISYPDDPNIIHRPSDVTLHPYVHTTLGDLETGISVCYDRCQYLWTWVFHQEFILLPGYGPGWVDIVPHPYHGQVLAANCEPGG